MDRWMQSVVSIDGKAPKPSGEPKPEEEKPKELKAAFKIEVFFSKHRSARMHVPSPAMVMVWESGKQFHGGGDQKMYWCGYGDCGLPFSSDVMGELETICPACMKPLVNGPDSRRKLIALKGGDYERYAEICGERLVNLTPKKLAELLAKTWIQLNGNADIYLKYSPYQLQYDKLRDSPLQSGKQLIKAREGRRIAIYPLHRLMQDTNSGASVQDCILAFLMA